MLDTPLKKLSERTHQMQVDVNIRCQQQLLTDPVFIQKLRTFKFAKDYIQFKPSTPQDNLTIFHCATPSPTNQLFQQRITANQEIDRQEIAGDDKTKLAKKNNKLFYQDKITTIDDAIKTLSNFWFLTTLIWQHAPLFWTYMQSTIKTLQSNQGMLWTDAMHSHNQIPVNLLLDTQALLTQAVVTARNGNIIQQATNNTPINPADTLNLKLIHTHCSKCLSNSICDGNSSKYLGIHDFHKEIQTQVTSNSNNDTNPSPTKWTRDDPDNAKGGIFKFTGTSLPTFNGIMIPYHKTRKLVKICAHNTIEGEFCNFEFNQCNKVHFHLINYIRDQATKEKINQHVQDTTGLSFTTTNSGQWTMTNYTCKYNNAQLLIMHIYHSHKSHRPNSINQTTSLFISWMQRREDPPTTTPQHIQMWKEANTNTISK